MTKISIQADKKQVDKDKKQVAADKKKLAADKKKLAADKKKIAAEAREAKKKARSEASEAKKKAAESKKKERTTARVQASEAKKKASEAKKQANEAIGGAGGVGGTYGGGGGGAVIINNPPKQATRARATKTAPMAMQTLNPVPVLAQASSSPNVKVINNMSPSATQSAPMASPTIPPMQSSMDSSSATMATTSTGGLMSANEAASVQAQETEPVQAQPTETIPVPMETEQPMAIRSPPERLLIGNELDMPTPGDSGRTVSDSSMFNFETPTGSRTSLDEIQIPASFTDRQMIEIADAQSQTDIMNAERMQTENTNTDMGIQTENTNADIETQTTPVQALMPIELLMGEPQRTSTGTQTEMDSPQKLLGNPLRVQTGNRLLGPTDLDVLRTEATQARERMRIAEIMRAAEVRENNKRLEALKEAERLKSIEQQKAEFRDMNKVLVRANILKNTLVPDIDEGVEQGNDEASSSRANTGEPAAVQAQAEQVVQAQAVPDSTKLNLKTSSEGKKFAEKHGLTAGQEVFLLATPDVNSNDGFKFEIFSADGKKLKKTTINEMRNIFKIPEASKQMERHGKIIKNLEIRDKYVG